MAFISYPRPGYNGGFVSEVEHERLVHAQAPDGLIGLPTDPSPVYADGLGTRIVKIRAAQEGLVRGQFFGTGDTDFALPQLAENLSGQPRIDLVVARLDRSDYTVNPVVITGTPAAVPQVPAWLAQTGTTGYYDLPLSKVDVPHNAGALPAGAVIRVVWYIGPDGQIVCTDKTRPPHTAGRSAWETNLKRWIVSDGTKWIVPVEDSGVTAVTLLAEFDADENFLHRRNGEVTLTLKVRRPDAAFPAGSKTKIANLPAGFFPTMPKQETALWWSGAQPVALRVEPAGGLYVVTPAGVSVGANRSVDGSISYHATT